MDGCKPVIKAGGNDESENDLFASKCASDNLFHGSSSSADVLPENGKRDADANRSDVTADEDLETIFTGKRHSKMETGSDPYVSPKNTSKTAHLNVPIYDGQADGFVDPGMCPDGKTSSAFQNRDADTAPNNTSEVKRTCDLIEATHLQENGEENKCVLAIPEGTGNYSRENSMFDESGEKDKIAGGEEKNEFLVNDVLKYDTECGESEMVNKSPKPNGSQEIPDQNMAVAEVKVKEDDEKQKARDVEIDELEDEDTVCGFGSFRPKWLQQFATPTCYLIIYGIVGILQGSYFSYLIGTISTLEKRFAFKSKISGVIMIIDEITPLFLGIFVGYFGGKAHRPRMVAFGMFLTTLCCFFSAMPFFIYGPAQHLVYSNSTGPDVCDFQQKREKCGEDDRPPTLVAVVFLILGSFLKGFGSLAYYAIGLPYMDDNVEKKRTPIYFGITFGLRMLGPTFGFLLSSAFLKIYENPFVDPGFGREDPRWIGAWWMGFILQAFLLLIFSLPLMLFPRRLPNQRKTNLVDHSRFEHEGFVQKMKGLFVGLKRLSTKGVYVCIIMEGIFASIGGFGQYMLLPKYMENQFKLSASDASLYAGPSGLVAHQVAMILGSVLLWRFRWSAKTIMAGLGATEFFTCLVILIMMIPTCTNMNFSGATVVGNGLELLNECNKDCLCTTKVFTPLCGPDGVSTYFSSCHAGCSSSLPEDIYGPEAFGNCSCVQDVNGNFINVQNMTKGFCPDENCWTQTVIYIILLPIVEGIRGMFGVGLTLVLLRCIDPEDKSFAMGTLEAIVCLFGFIPYPIIYGALADSACLIWEVSCGVTGNCWVYDMDKFNYLLHSVSAAFCLAAVVCDIRACFLCHTIKDLYKDDDDDLPEKQDKLQKSPGDATLINKSKESIESTEL